MVDAVGWTRILRKRQTIRKGGTQSHGSLRDRLATERKSDMSLEAFLRTNRVAKFSRRPAKRRCNLRVEELEKRELLATTLGLPIGSAFGTPTSSVVLGN